jgi:cbb3-type cytochrome oxidase maturation protein
LFVVNDITKTSVNVIFILIAVSLLVAIGFLFSFIWSIRTGQYDDEYTPSVRILFDDEVNVIEDENGKTDKSTKRENSKFHPPAGGPNTKQNTKNKKSKQHNNNIMTT